MRHCDWLSVELCDWWRWRVLEVGSRSSQILTMIKTAHCLIQLAPHLSRIGCGIHRLIHSTTVTWTQPSFPSAVWKLGSLNHVAIATPDLKKSTALYRDVLGAEVSDIQALPDHGVYTVFVKLDNAKLELLHPLGENSPIQNFLNKNKTGGIHHICIEVNDIKAAMKDLKEQNIRCLSNEPKIGAHGKPVVFLHPKDCDGVLVELEETKL
ncbi:ethylmalonyl-CoA/methylmalonyl-CoA epimerase-like isoform X3 [Cherax quadricarinatus]|uniref:ethylmalonyl-CoA/methylmalonyl-CoA epimerase-like isoform X3 n=1 Tax=Cherax quadricarinatus TaxID=27406 RepID=UPI00387E4533